MDDDPKPQTGAWTALALALPLIGGVAEIATKIARRPVFQESSIAARLIVEADEHRLPFGKFAEAGHERREEPSGPLQAGDRN